MNTVTTVCRKQLYPPMLLFLMAKPPVPAVPNAMQKLSNTGMPPSRRHTMHSAVSKM